MKQRYLTDSELVRIAVSAQENHAALTEAFEAIAERHRPAVLRWCSMTLPNPEAALDVGQMTFEDAFKSLKAGKPPAEPAKLGGWLIEFARRRRLEYLRKDQRPAGRPATGGRPGPDRPVAHHRISPHGRPGKHIKLPHPGHYLGATGSRRPK